VCKKEEEKLENNNKNEEIINENVDCIIVDGNVDLIVPGVNKCIFKINVSCKFNNILNKLFFQFVNTLKLFYKL